MAHGYDFTQDVRDVLAMAREEALRLRHEYIGTEHLLLGLLRERELGHPRVGTEHILLGLLREKNGIGGQVLMDSAVTEDAAWNAMMLLRARMPSPANAGAPKQERPVKRIVIEVQKADGTIVRHASETTRDAILFLLRS